jgi:hypothetical protein
MRTLGLVMTLAAMFCTAVYAAKKVSLNAASIVPAESQN